ncbi:MAG: Ku protein, partial [Nocardioidaceae bacterium]
QELKMARLLVDTLAGDYDPDEYEDDYQKAVEALVQAKLEGGEVKAPEEPRKSTGEVVDLLAALQRSVEAAKAGRGEAAPAASDTGEDTDEDTNEDTDAPEEKPAKKATTKKSAAKTSAKKAPAKKAAAKKSTAKKSTKKAATKKAS